MNEPPNQQTAVELLQELGLKEYEARCFVALSRRPQGTAKDISETSQVPRTRVYDAIKALETKGLAEVQHSSPKRFRTVPVDEAVETIRAEYEEQIEALRRTLRGLEPVDAAAEHEITHEVWALGSTDGIERRARQLLDDADEEIIMVLGDETILSEELTGHLRAARDRGVDVVVVGVDEEATSERIDGTLPDVSFVSDSDWLGHSALPGDDTAIGRLLMVDRSSILVSVYNDDGRNGEQAVFGRGFDNGLVAIFRRLIATGLLDETDA
jgi:sugar-specific transcriptional regulator TrmB